MKIDPQAHRRKKQTFTSMQEERLSNWSHWRDLADFYLPQRYVWLLSDRERNSRQLRNPYILDGTGTLAARILASGMMNGITSPARPWFRLRLAGFSDDLDYSARVWLDEVERRMRFVMAASNFYKALAVMYVDLVVFGTSAMLIFEDEASVIHCYNPAIGEFYLGVDSRGRVNQIARQFKYTLAQLVQEFGEENLTEAQRLDLKIGGAKMRAQHEVYHLCEPTDPLDPPRGGTSRFPFTETYWQQGAEDGQVLRYRGYREFPGVAPRWEVTGNAAYGSSPAMDALGDVIQLQQETKRKGQGLDKMVSPPMLVDVQLEHRPAALLPNGLTFVNGLGNSAYSGMRPAYQINIPIGELSQDIRDIQQRIRETFHNPLFNMISQLDTVRSATEIDARREEKLVLLGPVLERFENEALDPAINRIFNLMGRAGLLPEPPPSIRGADLEVQYVSILSSAQSAVGTVAVERWLAMIGNLAAVYPKATLVPNWEDLIRDYGRDLGVPAKNIRSREAVAEATAAADQSAAQTQALAQGDVLVGAAKQLSETDVGGGASALQRMIEG